MNNHSIPRHLHMNNCFRNGIQYLVSNILLVCLFTALAAGLQAQDCDTLACAGGVREAFLVCNDADFNCDDDLLTLNYRPDQRSSAIFVNNNATGNDNALSLIEGFNLGLRINFGAIDVGGNEGLVFLLVPEVEAIRPFGSAAELGFKQLPGTIGFVFDTEPSEEFPYDTVHLDHFTLIADSINGEVLFPRIPIRNPARFPEKNVETGTLINVNFSYDPEEQTLELYVDNLVRMIYKVDLVEYFGGQTEVFAGIVGSSGNLADRQEITVTNPGTREDPRDLIGCADVSNFRFWLPANNLDKAVWELIDEDKIRQSANGVLHFNVSPLKFVDAEMSCLVRGEGGDDDFIGICWGYSAPFAQERDSFDFFGITWRMDDQKYCNGPDYSPEGITVFSARAAARQGCDNEVNGTFFSDFEDVPGFRVLDRRRGDGTGWERDVDYRFGVQHFSDRFQVYIMQGNSIIYTFSHVTEGRPGRFALMNQSQVTRYEDFEYRWLPRFEPDAFDPCIGDTVTFSYSIANTFLPEVVDSLYWDFGDGTTAPAIVNGGIPDVRHVYEQAGVYHSRLVVVDPSGCETPSIVTHQQQITVHELPVVRLQADTLICPRDTLQLEPEPAGLALWQDGSSRVAFPASEPGEYQVSRTSEFGCIGRDTQVLGWLEGIDYRLTQVADCPATPGGVVRLSNIRGDGPFQASLDDEPGFWHTRLSAGEYELRITDQAGCSEDTVVRVDPGLTRQMEVVLDSVICFGESSGALAVFPRANGLTFSLRGDTLAGGGFFEGLSAGEYVLSVNDEVGCVLDTVFSVGEPPPLAIRGLTDDEIFYGECLNLTAIPSRGVVEEISWTPGTWLDAVDTASVTATPERTITYFVELTSNYGCEATESIRIIVDRAENFYHPTAFSPNGDGVNDWLEPLAGTQEKGIDLIHEWALYNRYGGLVYRVENVRPGDPALRWSGQYRGKPLVEGTYIYRLSWKYLDDRTAEESGSVVLVR